MEFSIAVSFTALVVRSLTVVGDRLHSLVKKKSGSVAMRGRKRTLYVVESMSISRTKVEENMRATRLD